MSRDCFVMLAATDAAHTFVHTEFCHHGRIFLFRLKGFSQQAKLNDFSSHISSLLKTAGKNDNNHKKKKKTQVQLRKSFNRHYMFSRSGEKKGLLLFQN